MDSTNAANKETSPRSRRKEAEKSKKNPVQQITLQMQLQKSYNNAPRRLGTYIHNAPGGLLAVEDGSVSPPASEHTTQMVESRNEGVASELALLSANGMAS